MNIKGIVLALLLAGRALAQEIHWETWSPAVFERAKREKRYVVLELEAVWCHWCHVMEETTYKDKRVLDRLNKHYIMVKVDQDARPDLSHRYEEYGWPATIFFAPDGTEIVCKSGYMPPDDMIMLLDTIVADPSPVARMPALPPAAKGPMTEKLRKRASKLHFERYDWKEGGYSFYHKFLNWDSCEYSLTLARGGEKRSARMARMALDGQLNLVDPVWGGVYQYSTDGDWKHPHFEKIMEHQANNLRVFTLGALYFREPRYQRAAGQIKDYLKNFLLSPEGAFYTSQDADLVKGEHSEEYFKLDDAARRARGMPAIDRHSYARENGWAAEAMLLYGVSFQDPEAVAVAEKAARWILKERARPEGGFSHDKLDAAGPFLADTLAPARCFLALYGATGQAEWLQEAEKAADFMQRNFVHEKHAGLATARLSGPLDKLTYLRDENVQVARFFNLLHHYHEKPTYKQARDQALAYLSLPNVALEPNTGGVLLADLESRLDPVHFTIGTPAAEALAPTVLNYPDFYRVITRAAAPPGMLVCDARGICSKPFQKAEELANYLEKLLSKAAR